MKLAAAIGVAAQVLLQGTLAAQQSPNETECQRLLGEMFSITGTVPTPCRVLAAQLVINLTNGFYATEEVAQKAVNPRDLLPTQVGGSDAAGSPAQSEAVPSVQPLALVGGSISAVGSDAGSDAITAISVNPSVFFGDGDSGETLARNSRLTDLTVFFPVDEFDRDDDGDVDYFGLRLRINVAGFSAGAAVWDAAEQELRRLVTDETTAALQLAQHFLTMPQGAMAGCVNRLNEATPDPAQVLDACGEAILPSFDRASYDEFRSALAEIREQVDSRYFGLDARLDYGDPTLGAVPFADATAITVGLAFGKQWMTDDPLAVSRGVRFRVGARHTHLRELDENHFAFDGGVAFLVRRPIDLDKAISLSGGIEARYGGVDDVLQGEFQSEYTVFRAMLSIPLTDATALSVGFSHPLDGTDRSQTLTVTGDWKLLLPDLLPEF
jgi:hypothetical protein